MMCYAVAAMLPLLWCAVLCLPACFVRGRLLALSGAALCCAVLLYAVLRDAMLCCGCCAAPCYAALQPLDFAGAVAAVLCTAVLRCWGCRRVLYTVLPVLCCDYVDS